MIFVSLEDSSHDPTYASADDVVVVDSSIDVSEGNPCVGEGVKKLAPVLPSTLDEIRAYASIIGWSVEFDNEGQMVLYTGVYDK